jgi:hypothetical protein
MLIFNNQFKPTIVDSVFDPLVTPSFWALNLDAQDFMFVNIGFLEEHNEKGKGFTFDGQYVELPNSWYILIAEEEEGTLDLIQVKDIRGRPFDAFLYDIKKSVPKVARMETFNPEIYTKFCHPIVPKNIMIVHPINSYSGIVVSSTDQYNKYIKNHYMTDFLV